MVPAAWPARTVRDGSKRAAARPGAGSEPRGKAEICRPRRPGVDEALAHLRALWGLDGPHPALKFPRAPPGRMNPMASAFAVPPRGPAQPPVPDMEQARRAHSDLASRLTDPGSRQLPPPGHPMHDRQDSLAALRAENDRLAKENADLRRDAGRDARDPAEAGIL